MKVYVAGSYQFRGEIREVVERLSMALPDFECTSTWIKQGEEDAETSEKGYQYFIDLAFSDIKRSDCLLLVNVAEYSVESAGKWVEVGVAMEMRKLIIVWGKLTQCLFTHDEFIITINGWIDDLIETLRVTGRTQFWAEHKDDNDPPEQRLFLAEEA